MINNTTKLLGVIGYPISHTLSPKIQNFMIERLGLNYCYLPFKIEKDSLAEYLKAAQLLNICGFNVTIPHKENAYKMVDEVFGDARESKSVNTVKFDGEKFNGYSTDGMGFVLSLKERNISFRDKRVLIIGAGGAARALVISAEKEGAKWISVINRDLERAKNILDGIGNSDSYSLSEGALTDLTKENDIIINCTPLGMHGIEADFKSFDFLDVSKKIVCDLIYNPLETSFLKNAAERGHFTINGLDMLIYQAILSLEIFTDTRMDYVALKNDVARILV